MNLLSIAATGMIAQQLNVEVISNNIANMNTTAFKQRRAEFQDLLYHDRRVVGSTSSDIGTIVPSGIQAGTGVRLASISRNTGQGNLIETNNPLDLAVQGGGYFQITLPDGDTAYTRAGKFQLSPSGQIVTSDGYSVLPNLTVPNNAVSIAINQTGEVLVKLDGQPQPQNIGQFQIAVFINENGLEAMGDNLFKETAASGAPLTGTPGSTGYGLLKQGFEEASNVNVVAEITNLITAQRAYEMNSKVVQSGDEMLKTLSQIT